MTTTTTPELLEQMRVFFETNIVPAYESRLKNGTAINTPIDGLPAELVDMIRAKYNTQTVGTMLVVRTKHDAQVAARRAAVCNMFDNICKAPTPADGSPINLEDFLDPVVAATPIDDDNARVQVSE